MKGFSVVGPDEDNIPVFHMGKEGILLELVEPVEFVDKEDYFVQPGFLYYLLYFLDADAHGAQGNEGELHIATHQPPQGCFFPPRSVPRESWMVCRLFRGDA